MPTRTEMSIMGIGIDLVEIDRIQLAMDRHGEAFEVKIFTEAERDYCRRQKHPVVHFAARFAAKEAVSKALGTGIGGDAAWQDLEILHGTRGEPLVKLSGAAKRQADAMGVTSVKISLTHARDYAAANAILIGGAEDG